MEILIGLFLGLVLGFIIGVFAGREQFRKEVSENFIKSVEALNKQVKKQVTISTMN